MDAISTIPYVYSEGDLNAWNDVIEELGRAGIPMEPLTHLPQDATLIALVPDSQAMDWQSQPGQVTSAASIHEAPITMPSLPTGISILDIYTPPTLATSSTITTPASIPAAAISPLSSIVTPPMNEPTKVDDVEMMNSNSTPSDGQVSTSANQSGSFVPPQAPAEEGITLEELGALPQASDFPLTTADLAVHISSGNSIGDLFAHTKSTTKCILVRKVADYVYTCQASCKLGDDGWEATGKVCGRRIKGRESYVRHLKGPHMLLHRSEFNLALWARAMIENKEDIRKRMRASKRSTRVKATRSSHGGKRIFVVTSSTRRTVPIQAPSLAGLRRSPRKHASSS